ncbi:hypothetical protein PJL18_02721 [Paenarthrobacter nicotinovorans]|nr:hypothetical protein [Paenarthrobacter nicotinovorans]
MAAACHGMAVRGSASQVGWMYVAAQIPATETSPEPEMGSPLSVAAWSSPPSQSLSSSGW